MEHPGFRGASSDWGSFRSKTKRALLSVRVMLSIGGFEGNVYIYRHRWEELPLLCCSTAAFYIESLLGV